MRPSGSQAPIGEGLPSSANRDLANLLERTQEKTQVCSPIGLVTSRWAGAA
jgi:hypothetical protein